MNMQGRKNLINNLFLFFIVVGLVACGSTKKDATNYLIPFPSELLTPSYLEDNTGKYMSPFTSDLVVADWVDKAIDADIGSNLGGLIGTHLGRHILGEIPFVGASLGQDMGEFAGRELAMNAIGGKAFLKESSDISFDSVRDMAVYLFKFNSEHPSYLQAVKATMVLYPELKEVYNQSIISAERW